MTDLQQLMRLSQQLQTKMTELQESLESTTLEATSGGGMVTVTVDGKGQVKRVQTLDLERSNARSKLSTLKKMEENFEWYRDGVRAVMKAEQFTTGANKPEARGADWFLTLCRPMTTTRNTQ